MKQCPKCAMNFNDDMAFCLNDGTPLPANATDNQPLSGADQMMPTVLSFSPPAPKQNYQQPPPQFNPPQIPSFATNTNKPGSLFTPLRIIIGLLVLFVVGGGLIAVIGFLVWHSSETNYTASTNYNREVPVNAASSPSKSEIVSSNKSDGNTRTNVNSGGNTSGDSTSDTSVDTPSSGGEPALFASRHGFVRDNQKPVDISANFPGAAKIASDCYDRVSPSAFVCGSAAVYSSTDAANIGYSAHIREMTGTRGKVLEKGDADGNPYVYYKDEDEKRFHFCVLINNQVSDYEGSSISLLQEFLK